MKSISVLWRRVWPRIIGNLAGGVSSRRKGRRNWSPRAEVLETRALLSSSTQLVLISLDGATSNLIDQYLASGALSTDSGIGYLRTHGVAATQNLTVSPSLTAPGHIAMVTGSTAAYNDVVGNSFRLLASPFSGGTTSGFAAPIGGYDIHGPAEDPTPTATPVWQTLQAAGKTVIAATFAGADGADIKIGTTTVQPAAERTVDYTVPFGAFAGVGAQGFTLTSGDFSAAPSQTQADLTATGHVSYSPVLQKTTKLETISVGGQTYNIQLAALDTTNDSTTNYDTLVFFDTAHGGIAGPFTPSPLGTGAAFVKASDHQSSLFYLEGSSTKAGTSFYVSSLAPDLSTIHLARYSANAIPRNPAVLGDIDDINNNVGFWAPQADFRIPEKLSPGFNNFADSELEAMYEDQVKTFVVYQTNVALWSLQKKPNADLSMFYIEQPDGSQHQFLLTDPRQPTDATNPNSIGAGQDAAKVARYQHYVEFAYQQADRAVQRIMDAVGYDSNGNLKRDVMVVSDHGFAPFHTAVNMTNIVNQQILPQVNAALTATSLPTIAASSLRAITSGPAVNVYLNLTGRDTAGTSPQISRQQYLVAQPVIASVLQALQDVNSTYTLGAASVSLFDKVYGRPLSNVSDPNFGLNTSSVIGQDSGDVFALLGLGYNFDGIQSPVVIRQGDTVSPSPILSVPNFYGAHGYDPSLPQMSAIFYAAGPDVGHGVIPVVHNIDIAPTIDAHFGLAPAPTVQGTAINLATPSAQLPNGVASGDTTQTTSVLWTHSYNLGTVTFELATDPGFQNIVAAPTAVVTDPLQPVKVSVAGLTPHTEYYYRATVAGRATAAGRFQTAAGSGTYNGVHFGVSGDIRGELAPYPSIGNADEKNLDFFLEFGDVIYADFPSPDLNKPQATTLADYRIKNNEVYASRYGLNTLADLRASTSILATTDDHEVTDNFAGGATIGSDPRFTGNPTDLINDSTLFENGMQAFQEFNPIRDDVYCATGDPRTAGERALYRFNTYGQDAAVFTLDNRSFRDTELPPVTNPFNPAQVGAFLAGSFNAGRTMLGQAQLAALKNDLLASQNNGITWKFVMTPEAIQNFGVLAGEDRWEGYAAERTQLLKFIHDNHIANVVFVTADLHGTVVNRVSYQEFPGGPQIQTDSFEIITGPVAFDKPFGPTIVDLAAGLGLVTGPQYNFYNSLPEGLAKESFVAGVINPQLTALGYNPISPTANPLPNMQLTQGLYMATAVYGWTEFGVDPDTQKLTVTTWGIDPYSQAQLEANPGAITGRTPRIVGQFVTTPVLPGAAQLVNTDLIVNGTTGNDTIVVAPVLSTNSVGNFTVTINGVSMGTFHPTGRIVANGLAGDDTVSLVGGINFSAWLYGGAGNDRLTGGNGANVLLGGAGNDVLTGGTRRDLLIGGLGIDKLSGNGDEDLLIGGTTSFDNRESALAAIMAEWTSSRNYATRVANIGGTGSGPRRNSGYFLKGSGPWQTVFDDGSKDTLTGGAGLDWYFGNFIGSGLLDTLTDGAGSETKSDL